MSDSTTSKNCPRATVETEWVAMSTFSNALSTATRMNLPSAEGATSPKVYEPSVATTRGSERTPAAAAASTNADVATSAEYWDREFIGR